MRRFVSAVAVVVAAPPDTDPPQTTIESGPTGTVNDSTPTFAFSSSEAGSTFECRVDAGAFAPCDSPHTTDELSDGSHTFEVGAIDAAGNFDSSPASTTFTIDTTAPQTTITTGPGGATNDNTPTFEFSSGELGSSFECRVDSADFGPCDSPHTTAALSDGSHTFDVRAKDAAGNVDPSPASRTFTVDAAPPQTTITSGPSGPTNDSTPTFEFSSSEAGSTFECRVDSGAFAACSSAHTTAALGDGEHTFSVRATDAAGNADPSPASRTFMVDMQAPQTTITGGPAGATNDNTPTFAFSSSEAGSTFECRVDSAPFAICSASHTTAALADGSHTVEVRAVDPAGNADASAASRTFTVDTQAPTTTITRDPMAVPNDSRLSFAFSSSEPGVRFECRVDDAPFEACSSPFVTAALTPGAHTFEVRSVDAAGNIDPTPERMAFVIDSPPQQPPGPPPPAPPPPPRQPPAPEGDKDNDGIPDAQDTSDASVGPTLGQTAVAQVVSGDVFIRLPTGRSSRQAQGTSGVPAGYVPLIGAQVIPVGSILHTTRGRVALTTASSTRAGPNRPTQRAEFYEGIFQLRQRRARVPTTDIVLRCPDVARQCGRRAGANAARAASGGVAVAAQARRRSRKVVSRVWGNGSGRFRMVGRHSSATVRGAIWLTEERCDGTLTRVTRGVVSVRDLRADRTVTVRAGRSYLARAGGASLRAGPP